ncbi:hypothetical protein [Paenibacillus mesotrionivorans]|uniref:Uncharacterized protein n=1 Tax=Paenibacillus mesotrionivorans TaxID=3160968 RepID=A0ACC7NVK1_9BACL
MPAYYFREIRTPLSLFRLKFFKDDDDRLWIKVGSRPRRRWRS